MSRAFAVLGLLALFYWLYSKARGIGLGDPDRYFHLSLARETVAAGKLWLKQIPQAVGLGWEHRFPDKEFLFHFVNRFLWAWRGDAGVLALAPGVSATIVLAVLFWISRIAGFWPALAITLFGWVLDPYLLIRTAMLRPHLLAILFFVLFLLALWRSSVLGVWLAGALYAWSYHSFYVPLLVLVIYAGVEQLTQWNLQSKRIRILAWGTLGLLTGLIVNPAFPGNLIMGFRHLIIALFEVSTAPLDFGMELFPWTTEKFVRIYLPFCFLLVATPWIDRKRDDSFLWVWAASLVFFALAAKNPRAIEYAVPCGLMLFAVAARSFAESRKKMLLFLLVLAVSSIPRGMQISAAVFEKTHPDERSGRLVEALKRLSPPLAGRLAEQFYNVEWDASPYIYYAQPDFQFVDILDPSFLSVFDKRHHDVRFTLRKGEVPDPWGLIQSLGKKGVTTRYLLTRYPALVEQLGRDPHFNQVYPEPSQSVPESWVDRVYELKTERDPHFVTQFEGAVALESGSAQDADAWDNGIPSSRWLKAMPMTSEHFHPTRVDLGFEGPPVPSVYLDLRYGPLARTLKAEGPSSAGAVSCVMLRPSVESRKKQNQKTVMALGGGRSIRVWLNGSKFFRTVAASHAVDPMHRMVVFDRALTPADRIEILVCSKADAKNFGLTLSFWSPNEIVELCRSRGWKPAEGLSRAAVWPRQGEHRETCFGSYVR